MTDRYVSLAGPTMHTGWMKKISVLEEQMKQKERQLIDLAMKVRKLEEQVAALLEPVPAMTEYKEVDVLPVKRGPGRPRKNPQ